MNLSFLEFAQRVLKAGDGGGVACSNSIDPGHFVY